MRAKETHSSIQQMRQELNENTPNACPSWLVSDRNVSRFQNPVWNFKLCMKDLVSESITRFIYNIDKSIRYIYLYNCIYRFISLLAALAHFGHPLSSKRRKLLVCGCPLIGKFTIQCTFYPCTKMCTFLHMYNPYNMHIFLPMGRRYPV